MRKVPANLHKPLPLGIQTFQKVIEGGYLYADKTRHILQLLRSYKSVFLSRPRCFGKSLFVSTIKDVFQGSPELFQGLSIGSSGYDFAPHPVIHIGMTFDWIDISGNNASPDIMLARNIIAMLRDIAEDEGLKIEAIGPGEYLQDLAKALSAKYGKRVVILVDSYDTPILDHMADAETAMDCAAVLRGFYGSFKEADRYIRFIFVTGITELAKLAMEDGLNNLFNISLDDEYSDICGFTAGDLAHLFGDRYEETLADLKKSKILPSWATSSDMVQNILHWYDGYNFGGKRRVLNPISILNFFSDRKFSDYWIDTGPPPFLRTVIAGHPQSFILDNLKGYNEYELRQIDLRNPRPGPLLFQTGYLTIESETFSDTSGPLYSLRVPNLEVAISVGQALLKSLFGFGRERRHELTERVIAAIESRDAEGLQAILRAALRQINPPQYPPKERFYQSVIQTFFFSICLNIRPEESSETGGPVLDFVLPGGVYVAMEAKYRPLGAAAGRKPDEEKERLLSEAALEAINQCLDRERSCQSRLEATETVNIGIGLYDSGYVKVLFERPEPLPEQTA
jgi:hypothetical protein